MNTQTSMLDFIQASKDYNTIPILQQFFADTVTPIQLMQQLQEQAVFLLESNDLASPWANYSFIGLNPKYTLKEQNNSFFVLDENKTCLCTGASFQEVFQFLHRYLNPMLLKEDLPFSAGGVGFIAYDAVTHLEKIPSHSDVNQNDSKYHFVFCDTIIVYDHHNKVLKVIQHVSVKGDETSQQLQDLYSKTIRQGMKLFDQCMNSPQIHIPISFQNGEQFSYENSVSNYTKERFIEHVDKVKQYIRNGDIFQAVLSQRWEVDITVTGFELYRILRVVNPSPYLFYIKLDDVEIVGSSPERLVQVYKGQVEIHPIAGTRKRGLTQIEDESLAQDLLKDEKELAEHYMLVDLARNDVGRVAQYGSVHTPVLIEIAKFSHVMHMISKVRGRLATDKTPIDAMLASFPAGTVSGAPKIRAMQIIHELEPTSRGIYAGAIGYLGFDGNIDSCIAIRTMVIRNQKAFIQAGAGIVWDSVPEKEFEETQNKARALMQTITIAENTFRNEEVVQYV
jgi:anthranilate synthase component I